MLLSRRVFLVSTVEDPDMPTIDFAITHAVAMSDQPVFFITIKPGNIHSESARLAADA